MSAPPQPEVPTSVTGRWFNDLAEGEVIHHAIRRTVTEADNVLFTCLTMNPQPLHLDAEYAAGTEFGRPLMNSLFTVALVTGITVTDLTLGTVVANLGFEEITTPSPVYAGDTIRVETTVVSTRPSSSRPGQGIATFEHRGYKQSGELVALITRSVLMHGRS